MVEVHQNLGVHRVGERPVFWNAHCLSSMLQWTLGWAGLVPSNDPFQRWVNQGPKVPRSHKYQSRALPAESSIELPICWLLRSVYSFNKYLLSTYYVSGMVLGTGDIMTKDSETKRPSPPDRKLLQWPWKQVPTWPGVRARHGNREENSSLSRKRENWSGAGQRKAKMEESVGYD